MKAQTSQKRRVQTDLLDVMKQEPVDVFVEPRQDRDGNQDIMTVYGMVVGPSHTPYARGTFSFRMTFTHEYPFKPPKVVGLTTANGTARFNPNVYANGMVCLSILGTWKGNPWSSAHNIESVLRSIQSLLHDKPYVNEPGFEDDGATKASLDYNLKLSHATIDHAILAPIESVLDFQYPHSAPANNIPPALNSSSSSASSSCAAPIAAANGDAGSAPAAADPSPASPSATGVASAPAPAASPHPGPALQAANNLSPSAAAPSPQVDAGRPLLHHNDPVSALFGGHIKRLARMYICAHEARIESLAKDNAELNEKPFFNPRFEHHGNQLAGTFDWGSLKSRLKRVRERLEEERELYIRLGHIATVTESSPVTTGTIRSEVAALNANPVEDVSADHAPDNVYLWDVTIMCAQGTTSASGCFAVEMLLTPNWPDELPIIRFRCKMYHPNISPEGMPFMTCSPRRRLTMRWVLEKLVELIKSDPSTDPLRHLHPEAAEDCFNQNEEGRRKYRKRAQRAAEDAMSI